MPSRDTRTPLRDLIREEGARHGVYPQTGTSAADDLGVANRIRSLGLTGQDIPNVPKFQLNLGLNYTQPIAGPWLGTLAADIVYRDAENAYFQSNIYNVALAPYTLLNLRAGVSNGPWTVTAFAHNVTDKIAQVSAISSIQDREALLTVLPRTVGVTVTRKF